MDHSQRILAVDDNPEALFALQQLLEQNGFQVVTASNGTEAIDAARREAPDLILLDVIMPEPDGFEVTRVLKIDPVLKYIPIVLLTAQDELDDIVKGFELGADDYIRKPFQRAELLARISAVTRIRGLYRELAQTTERNQELQTIAGERFSFANIIGHSAPMQELFRLIEKVKDSNVSVLITGESGTGKELVAKAIHFQSPRATKPFVVQNCSAFNENLLESELFGHVKGAFTGAIRDKQGLFEVADGGSFFLDELGEMSPALQVKLLRVLQDGTFTPVGATKSKKVEVRIIAATNRNLLEMVKQGTFREDLYYRLNVVNLVLPALRERTGDIPVLAEHFLKHSVAAKGRAKRLSPGALAALVRYPWPGNIRELENEIERVTIMSGAAAEITPEHLSPRMISGGAAVQSASMPVGELKEALARLEREMISKALEQTSGNKSEAARMLGISRSNLISKVQAYGIESEE